MKSSRGSGILGLATKGPGSNEEERLRELLQDVEMSLFQFERAAKARSFVRLLRTLASSRPSLAIMEGTSVAAGLAFLLARLALRLRYIVSSGDAVGPFIAGRYPLLGGVAGLYERLLCRHSAGFIGWTPYLVGRALSFGAPRAMTAAGWAPFPLNPDERVLARDRIRQKLEISADALVVGIVGSLAWSPRVGYCYGQELVRALHLTKRRDLRVLIVGDGDGSAHLKNLAGEAAGKTALFVGQVDQRTVPEYLAAMDIASLPQSVDGVGSFRYTTKLSEYVASGLPIVTSQIPLAYDLDDGWIWRLPGHAPWDNVFVNALAHMLEDISPGDIATKRAAVPTGTPMFDRELQRARVTAFLTDMSTA